MNLEIDEYLAAKYEWALMTKDTARKHLSYLAKWLEGREIEDVGISDYEAWVVEKSWGNSMRLNSLWACKDYLNWAGIDHPLLAHKVKRRIPPPGSRLTQEDVFRLLGQCYVVDPGVNFTPISAQGYRDYAVVVFLWETWCRASELCGVQLAHLDLERKEVMFKVKGGEYHVTPFGPDLQDALRIWLVVRKEIVRPTSRGLFVSTVNGKDLTYPSLRQILRRLGEKAGIPVTAHAFRRGAAIHHAEQGGSDRMGMARGRWVSPNMWFHYTRSVSLEFLKQQRWLLRGEMRQEGDRPR